MASLFFKRSSWYWERFPGGAAAEEEDSQEGPGIVEKEDEINDEEKSQQGSAEAGGHVFMRYGIVVILAWMFSESRQLAPFIRLYKSLGWDCLACHPHPLTLHFPGLASQLAKNILLELVKDLESHPGPVVFVVFSGGHKTCLYKIIQILLDQCKEVNDCKGKFKVVEESIAGLIFDSSPVEFETSIGAKVLSQQVFTLKPGQSTPIISYAIHGLANGMNFVFLKPLSIQKRELWHALYSAVNVGPMLILCSEEDELAPIETIHIFTSNVRRLGGKIDLVAWKDSKHVGHFRRHPERYTNEVKRLLIRAVLIYSDRIERGTTTWTDLPGTIIAEIDRMSKTPHLHLKKESIAELGSSPLSNDIDIPVEQGEIHGLQSRL